MTRDVHLTTPAKDAARIEAKVTTPANMALSFLTQSETYMQDFGDGGETRRVQAELKHPEDLSLIGGLFDEPGPIDGQIDGSDSHVGQQHETTATRRQGAVLSCSNRVLARNFTNARSSLGHQSEAAAQRWSVCRRGGG